MLLALFVAIGLCPVAAQAPARIATTAGALVGSPFFFHGKQVVVRHALDVERDPPRLSGTVRPVFVFWRERPSRSDGEIRGEFWDIGRFEEGDARLAGYDLRPVLEATQGRWPPRERVFVILGATLSESPLPQAPTLRAIALSPETYEGKSVTVTGRFKGVNLYGDLPKALGKSKWDFVLQSADAALWVSGSRPRGKGFELDPTARVDTGRWLQVTGIVRREGDTAWIEGETVSQASAPQETAVEIAVPLPKEPPPSVIFSAPVGEDTDVDRAGPIRIQFSRDMAGRSFRDAVRVSYVSAAPGTQPAAPPFTATYTDGTRSLEIRFKEPLARFQSIRLELLEGITAVDGQPLPPWTLLFTTGG